ncbi:hypothetical protein ACFOON_00770 [Novosphingobium piscinae]|uniref:SnoaL-like domain-containing protein n=1 Tax=Novosphingobium piscinae TaxID=1507448 RepID=A0A7X1KNQ7_9SPHN|nr:hypothetical protein [Novosphingobium piscinae]MBC2667887.1 hypothetical protein [Novosphingobium piscinae]
MQLGEYLAYAQAFGARAYDDVLTYWAPAFRCEIGGINMFSNGAELKAFYGFLHDHITEEILVDRYLADDANVFMEARVRISGLKSLSADRIRESGFSGLYPIEAGQRFDLPQLIHYHRHEGKFTKAICLMNGAPIVL